MPESHENKDGLSPSSSPKKGFLVLLVVAIIGLIVALAILRQAPKTADIKPQTNAPAPVATAPVLFTNQEALKLSDPRWAGVLGFLESMKQWSDANPICHMLVTTEGMGGKIYSDTEVFKFKDADSTNLITRVKIHLRFPNEVTFIVEKTGESIIAYLPETDQLLKVDAAREISTQYGLDMQNPDTSTLFSLMRIAFVETNGTDRALTFAFKPEVLNVPSAASADAFTTLRIDAKGELKAVEQTTGSEHHVMQVKYLGFNQEEVSRSAPQIPANKPVVTGKAFNLALQEEIIKIRDKGTKI